MISPSLFNRDNCSDVIDMVVCTLFVTASIFGSSWLLMSLAGVWSPVYRG